MPARGPLAGGSFGAHAHLHRHVEKIVRRAVVGARQRHGLGGIARHRHAGGVHAWVFKGRWHYLEHDWVAEEGSYIFEPPGETHTLVVPEGCNEMVTLFQVNGSLMYVDPQGASTGYDDVFTRIDKARAHYAAVGLGESFVEQFIR